MLAAGAGVFRSACPALTRRAGVTSWMGRAPTQYFQPVSALSAMAASRSGQPTDADGVEGEARTAVPGGGRMSRHTLPPRTVSDEILGFSCRTYMSGDSEDRYPNVHGVHPAEFKVELMVPVPLLGLSPKEEERLIQLVGPRYRAKDKELRLVSDRFPNRIDNKRYLVHLLENILVEARNVDEEE